MSIDRLINVIPTTRQLSWHTLEFYAFVHYGINTYYDKEWGNGCEDPKMFNPTDFDADQWVKSIADGGMKGLLLTCKHHDGFCLWPSKYTEHSIKNSPYKGGKGDIVKEVADSCKRHKIAFGVYLSPWDRNCGSYGDTPKYNDFFVNQLTELLTEYGEVFSVWFDGACGEGPNGKVQDYDWDRYYDLIRKLQPNAVINVCGPDVRWCGNEAGVCRTSEWNVVPKRLQRAETVQARSQQVDSTAFRENPITSSDEDLGSRDVLLGENDLVWYPAEVNTSIRPGWFYHKEEDDKVRTLDELLEIYYNSVGGNAAFLLNLPPDKRGLIHENDVTRLKEIGDFLKNNFSDFIFKSSNPQFIASEGDEYEFCISLPKTTTINHIVLQENLEFSQRVEKFEIIADNIVVYDGTVIGSKKICKFIDLSAIEIKIRIKQSRSNPYIKFVGLLQTTK